MKELELNIPEHFTVPSINPWFETGILLRATQTYRIEVMGKQTWKDGDFLGDIPPDGIFHWYLLGMHPSIRMPSAKWFALLGSIGKKRPYFKIGTLKENFAPEEDGQLMCFANDSLWLWGHFYKHNNTESLNVTITRTK
jgi:hypothetical protein